jgi:phosphoribosylamine--glycine ligase
MNILLLGSGGREHAFAWKMKQSPLCNKIFIAPGNAGTEQEGTNLDIAVDDFEGIKAAVLEYDIEMIVVGPELPLVNGIYDYFQEDEDLKEVVVIGPSKKGAQLEGSKSYAKGFMDEFNIPTAGYAEFTAETVEEGVAYIATQQTPIVLKADGLAAGKGVLIINDITEAQAALREMLAGQFGEASAKVVIEEFLDGIEFSVFVVTDGKDYKLMPVAKDYKRIGEGDQGLNTGGMGAVSPPPFVDDEMMRKVEQRIISPTIAGLQSRDITYQGFVFIGVISVKGEPYVIEYNCRMGDPETEVVLPRFRCDFVELMLAANKGTLDTVKTEINDRFTATVFLVSGGYPEAYEKEKAITNLEQVHGSLVFHGGTKRDGHQIVTSGGRVIAITSFGFSMQQALDKCYQNADVIQFQHKNYRRDIGFDLK